MKVLMLTPYLPYPPSSGGQVRSYNLIKRLSKSHEITLFSLIKYDSEKRYVQQLKKFCKEVVVFERSESPWTLKNILRTGFGKFPFLVVRNLSRLEMKEVARKLAGEKFDIIHAETFYVMPHIPQTKVPILLVDQTIEYQVYQHFVKNFRIWAVKPLLFLDIFKLKFWEKHFWMKAARVIAVSEDDKRKMKSLAPSLNVEVVPNGVDLEFFSLPRIGFKKSIIFFQGNFTWLQNVEAARILVDKVFPIVKKEIPDAECWISGQGITSEIRKTMEKSGVLVKEILPNDIQKVRQIYRQAKVLVAPLYGPGGTRLKILAAMASRVPVVTTSIGIEGIGARIGKEVLIEEEPDKIAKLTIRLLKDKPLYQRISQSAYEMVAQKYSWDGIAQKLNHIYKEVAGGKKD
jgi:glycosyltransferase involved in cell wall biosynthesis